jgi:hypothetical protein
MKMHYMFSGIPRATSYWLYNATSIIMLSYAYGAEMDVDIVSSRRLVPYLFLKLLSWSFLLGFQIYALLMQTILSTWRVDQALKGFKKENPLIKKAHLLGIDKTKEHQNLYI